MRGKQLFYLVAAATLVLDQIAKFLADNAGLAIHNKGSAFGLVVPAIIPILLSLAAILVIVYYRKQILKNKTLCVLSAIILGGVLGNLIDRLFLGFVRDFINFRIWPAFNLADAGLTIGVVGLIVYLAMKKR